MNRLFRIIRRAHCIGTHQCLAIDALKSVRSPAGLRLVPWILRYHRAFLRGAIDPDTRFCDHHNHIIHVRDGGWGGAPRVAQQWYDRLQGYLREERFCEAAHSAGVLSHYLADVTQPLHTISSDREALIHRSMEWSIARHYDQILRYGRCDGLDVRISLSDKPEWLRSLMLHAAKHANRHVDELIKRYHFPLGSQTRLGGLDNESVGRISELLILAQTAIGQVIERAAGEAEYYLEYPIPECGGPWGAIGATVGIPFSLIKKVRYHRTESAAVQAIEQEYRACGTVVHNLPAEIDIKQRVILVRRNEMRRLRRSVAA